MMFSLLEQGQHQKCINVRGLHQYRVKLHLSDLGWVNLYHAELLKQFWLTLICLMSSCTKEFGGLWISQNRNQLNKGPRGDGSFCKANIFEVLIYLPLTFDGD